MSEMKDKLKGFMKKVNTQFSSSSSSSGKFKGQGRVLGSSSSGPVNNPTLTRPTQSPKPILSSSSSNSKPVVPSKPPNSDQDKPSSAHYPEPTDKPGTGFDPYDSFITSSKVSKNGFTLNVFECPICGASYKSEEEVSIHVETCIDTNSLDRKGSDGDPGSNENVLTESRSELEVCVGSFLSSKPPEGSIEVVLKLLRNIVKEPGNYKFRRIRMGNPKIREAVGEVAGGVELLEFVGFGLKEEGGEMWAVMEVPKEEQISLINKAVMLLEPGNMEQFKKSENIPHASPVEKEESVEPKKIDRKIRVFFSVPESVAAKIELPDSFYNLSIEEVKREAEMRKKKIAESQLLIPKSYKEKQAKATRRRYRRTIIRIQFPDGVVLQGEFAPWEPTSALYEFVSSALKEPCLEFELFDPVVVRRRVIPSFPAAGEKARTLEEEDLVPSALVKFKPVETDSIVFTGLCNELLEISEPLESSAPA
ncbi:Plant UBX domain-containing protein 2 [Hibiscus syriacus]|uniref:Plant UBX domain-containing protein 2 n=1 Tax=Hibiscus syriacus TaxID=106335 RepID=A0A6A3ARG3_HIBSY|nr:plant UBX domain-containing protein 2-like [Hibiscus syriacus]KAE8705442.1 Plant UBX domain-containing protein 2 [Hibiscus syriacus]